MEKELLVASEYENKILDIIDNLNEFSRGDLQGAIQAQVIMCLRACIAIVKSQMSWK
jgi:hypothetical protein